MASSPIHARRADPPVVADGKTSDTDAWNAIIDCVNASGGHTSIIVPQGQSLVDPLHPIMVSGVFFVSESRGPDLCRFKQNSTGTLFQWGGDTTQYCECGGMIDIGFDGNADTVNPVIDVKNAARMTFDGLGICNVGAFMRLDAGVAVKRWCSQIRVRGLHGWTANVAAPVISAVNGSGLEIISADVFCGDVSPIITECRFLEFSGSWDTARMTDSMLQRYGCGVYITASAGNVIQSVKVIGGFMDSVNEAIVAIAESGGNVYALEVFGVELTAFGGPNKSGGRAIMTSGSGTFADLSFCNNRILQCEYDGILINSSASAVRIQNNDIYAIQRSGLDSAAINCRLPLSCAVISGNNCGMPNIAGGATPSYGIIISSGDSIAITGNVAFGKAAPIYTGACTNTAARGNVGLADF